MSPDDPTPAAEQDPPAATRILEAACELIAAEGIEEVRIARVAQRAGASTSLVHHYFSTREDLLEQALVHSFEQAGDERFGDGDGAGGGDAARGGGALDALAAAIRESLPYPGRQEREWVLWVELWIRAVREPGLRPVAARMYERYRAWMTGLIAAGVESGELGADVDVEGAAELAVALLDGAGVRAMLGDPGMDVDDARRLVAAQLAGALGIDPGRLEG
ncbi:MAG: TetR family transcriptional regulator C-terminal domain-containing protein [Thermoleophilia bacterium]|nr:TetR family transcriptional regulator C-terminal domain-containing protein [Thermoleophilia bacterium]